MGRDVIHTLVIVLVAANVQIDAILEEEPLYAGTHRRRRAIAIAIAAAVERPVAVDDNPRRACPIRLCGFEIGLQPFEHCRYHSRMVKEDLGRDRHKMDEAIIPREPGREGR